MGLHNNGGVIGWLYHRDHLQVPIIRSQLTVQLDKNVDNYIANKSQFISSMSLIALCIFCNCHLQPSIAVGLYVHIRAMQKLPILKEKVI